MFSNKREFYNLLNFIKKNINYTPSVIVFYIKLSFTTVLKKLYKNRLVNYPERANSFKFHYEDIRNTNNKKIVFTKNFSLKTSLINLILKKNTTWLDIDFQSIKDHETINSIHRWYWIIYDINFFINSDFNDTMELVKSWINYYNNANDDIIWQPYNVSERISSLSIFLLNRLKDDEVIGFIKQDILLYNFIIKSINILSTNLEYYPNGVTYNHVINNLKGLLTGSILCNDKERILSSLKLIFNEFDIIFEEKGLLREGSSHYQFIVTRWICELEYILKKFGFNEIVFNLNIYTINLIQNCIFYVVYDVKKSSYTIPLFGDISPDFDPQWIIDYFSEAYQNKNLNSNISYGKSILQFLNINSFNLKNNFKSIGYLHNNFATRIIFKEIDLFISHPKSKTIFFPNHSHEDYSSFVLFINGQEVISDPGRYNYETNEISTKQCHSIFHNVIEVNKQSIFLSEINNYYFPTIYKKFNTSINILNTNDDSIYLKLKTNSLNRIAECRISNYTRTFNVSNKLISITDYIEGEGKINISMNLSFSPNINFKNNIFSIINLNPNDFIEFNMDTNYDDISKSLFYNSKKYGQYCIATNLKFYKKNALLPFKASKTFKIN